MYTLPLIAVGLVVLEPAAPVDASPRGTWKKYIIALGKGDKLDLLACYALDLRKKVSSSGLRLQRHDEAAFALVQRDQGVKVVDSGRSEGVTTLTVEFQEKKDRSNTFRLQVLVVKEDGRGRITDPPQLPGKESCWKRRIEALGTPGRHRDRGRLAGRSRCAEKTSETLTVPVLPVELEAQSAALTLTSNTRSLHVCTLPMTSP